MRWSNLSIKWKIWAMPAISLVALLCAFAANLVAGGRTSEILSSIDAAGLPALNTTWQLRIALNDIRRALQDAVATEDADALAAIDELRKSFEGLLEKARGNSILHDAGSARLSEDFRNYYEIARTASAAMIRHATQAEQPTTEEVTRLGETLEEMQRRHKDLESSLQTLSEHTRGDVKGTVARVDSENRSALTLIALVIVAAAASLALISFISIRSITGPLQSAANTMKNLADGRLGIEVEVHSHDETGRLLQAMREMVAGLRGLIGDIRQSSAALSSSATQISASSEELAKGSDGQARYAGEVVLAAEEMAGSVQAIADSTREVKASSRRAKSIAQDGGNVISKALDTLDLVSNSIRETSRDVADLSNFSGSIGQVTEAIREIAAQTKLLALNAAIEAARAGDYGRGFEVVADEVGHLAEKSGTFVAQIGGQLEAIRGNIETVQGSMTNILNHIQESSAHGANIREALRQLTDAAGDTDALATRLAETTDQQSATSEEVARMIHSIAELTRSNASSTEEISSTAAELAALAQQLEAGVARFQLGSGEEEPQIPNSIPSKSHPTDDLGRRSARRAKGGANVLVRGSPHGDAA